MLPGNEAILTFSISIRTVMQGNMPPEEATKKIEEGWNKVTDDMGRQEQIKLWRSGVESGMYLDKF